MKFKLLSLMAAILGVLTAVSVQTPSLSAQSQQPPRDFKHVNLEEFGIKRVSARKDPKTGFIVGGKNPTSLIKELKEINGRVIADLERDMRPGAKSDVGSEKGFLGADEKLLDVLTEDNKYVVDELGLTHRWCPPNVADPQGWLSNT